MIFQPEYFVAISYSYSEAIGDAGIVFGDRKQCKLLRSIAQAYSREIDGIVIVGKALDFSLIHAYYHGTEVYPVHNEDDGFTSFVSVSNGCMERLREGRDGFYLEMA